MDRLTRFWLLLILVMLPGFTEAAPPETISALQNLQIHANRATSSLLLYRGEGFQKAHLLRLEDDIRALNAALLNVANPTSALRESHQALQARLLSKGRTLRPNCQPRLNTWPFNTSAVPTSARSRSLANSRTPISGRTSVTWCRRSTLSWPNWMASAIPRWPNSRPAGISSRWRWKT